MNKHEKLKFDGNKKIVSAESTEEKSSSASVHELTNTLEHLKIKESSKVKSDKFKLKQNCGDCRILDEGLEEAASCENQIFGGKKRSVQWKDDVDVIYYTGNIRGGMTIPTALI